MNHTSATKTRRPALTGASAGRAVTGLACASLAVAGVISTATPSQADDGSSTGVTRIGGTDRVDTALRAFEANRDRFDSRTLVLTRGDSFPDALSATPLAGALRAPLLTNVGATLDSRIAELITRTKVQRVYLVGGEKALSRQVAQAVARAGAQITRISGPDRYSTATTVARAVLSVRGRTSAPVFLATGEDFPDALSAGAAAAHTGGVVLLSQGHRLDSATKNYLSSNRTSAVTAVGSPAVRAVVAADVPATHITGADRYTTSVNVALRVFDKPASAVLASGAAFADALPGGALGAQLNGPLLLTPRGKLADATGQYLAQVRPRVVVLGGTTAVSETVEAQASRFRTGSSSPSRELIYAGVTVSPDPTEGRPFTLTAFVGNPDAVTVQWQKWDASVRGMWRDLPGATSLTYTVDRASRSDEGRYRVVLTNPAERVISRTLEVKVRPTGTPATLGRVVAATGLTGSAYTQLRLPASPADVKRFAPLAVRLDQRFAVKVGPAPAGQLTASTIALFDVTNEKDPSVGGRKLAASVAHAPGGASSVDVPVLAGRLYRVVVEGTPGAGYVAPAPGVWYFRTVVDTKAVVLPRVRVLQESGSGKIETVRLARDARLLPTIPGRGVEEGRPFRVVVGSRHQGITSVTLKVWDVTDQKDYRAGGVSVVEPVSGPAGRSLATPRIMVKPNRVYRIEVLGDPGGSRVVYYKTASER